MRPHLELIQDHGSTIADRGPNRLAADVCDQLCSGVDDAVTLEEALRSVLASICRRMEWTAGRASRRDVNPVWYVGHGDAIPILRRVVTPEYKAARTFAWHEPWSISRRSGLWTFVFPIEWSSDTKLELYSIERWSGKESALDELALALVPVGALLRRKPPEKIRKRSQDDYQALFDQAPDALFVVDPKDRVVLGANSHAATLLGRGRSDILGQRIDDLFGRSAELEKVFDPQSFRPVGEVCVEGRILELVATRPEIGRRVLLLAARDVTRRNALERALETAAYTDALTGLHNRSWFDRHLSTAVERCRSGARFAVLFLDLDRFKVVNDSLGHGAGDALLCEVAHRLRSQLRAGDLAARLGGDEFTVLLSVREPAEALRVVERIQRALLQPFLLGKNELYPSASIGVALAGPHTSSTEAVLREADTAMYRAKAKGPGNVAVFDESMHVSARETLELESDLRRALNRDEMLVYLQPIVSLETSAVKGFEALTRWNHAGRGWVSPSKFIPLAEQTGLIGRLGTHVLRGACAQLRELHRSKSFKPRISVNLSPRQLQSRTLVDEVSAILSEAEVDPRLLQLEVTETTLVDQGEGALRVLSALRERGVRIAMDDFGTGYSSLSYLHRFPIDAIKLDQSFVRALPEDGRIAHIVQAVVTLGRNLGMEIIAEGVETEAQATLLRELGCDSAQGFLYSPAVAPREAAALLEIAGDAPRSYPPVSFTRNDARACELSP